MQSSSSAMEQRYESISQLVKALQSLERKLGLLRERDCVSKFGEFLSGLQQIFEQLDDVVDGHGGGEDVLPPAALATACSGIKQDLRQAEVAFECYQGRSSFYIVTHCHSLKHCLEQLSRSIGQWLSLVPSEKKELHKKIQDQARDMQQATFKVAEAEENCYLALGKLSKGKPSDMMLAGSIWRDLVRLIGLDPESSTAALVEQIELLKRDLEECKLDAEVPKMEAILGIYEQVSLEPQLKRMYSYKESQDRDPLEPFESFFCPLTKQIMKDPVIVESDMTYERSAIERWFKTCRSRGRDVTCPVSGSTLASTDLRSNLILKHTIDEWSRKNATIRIQHAVSTLSSGGVPLEKIEKALDGALKACDDSPSSKYELSTSGIVPLLLQLWKTKVLDGSHIRSKGLVLLQHAAVYRQELLMDLGVLKCAVRSLSSSLVNEVENSLKLLYGLSKDQSIARRLGSEKGAIIHLLAVSSNSSGNAALALLAEQTLKNLEQEDANVQDMAEAGRLEPLFARLCSGSVETRIAMGKCLSETRFVDVHRERKAVKVLVGMLSQSLQAKEAAMGALLNLSMLQDNIPILVMSGILPAVYEVTFSSSSTKSLPGGLSLKEAAATTLSNIVAVPGSWESVKLDDRVNTLQSEACVQDFLGLFSAVNMNWNTIVLKILIGIASSPQAAESVTKRITSGSGMSTLLALLEESRDANRLHVLDLLNVLSKRAGKEVARSLADSRWLSQLKNILLLKNPEEAAPIASILSNIPLREDDILRVLGVDMVSWCIDAISEAKARKFGSSRMNSAMLEGLLGILVQFTTCSSRELVDAMMQQKLMLQFRDSLQLHGQPLVKQRAATGLANLSQKSFILKTKAGSRRVWFQHLLLCVPSDDQLCPLHRRKCCDELSGNFCLVDSNAVGLLVELLEDDDQEVQLAAVEALCTLVGDGSVDAGVEELAKADGVRLVMQQFRTTPKLRDKGVYLVERILRVREHGQRYSLDEGLMRLLVEVFKRGSPAARKNAEAALAHTNMLSIVSGSSGPKPKSAK